jgi:CheY-like chemotaxis protein
VAGYEVHTAANGLKLLSILKVNRPDLIILDIMMNWVDGYELCRIIKRTEEFHHIPVVFLTGCSAPEDVRKGYAVGCAAYLTKPVDNEVVLERVRALLAGMPDAEAIP